MYSFRPDIGIIVRVFVSCFGDQGSIPGQVIPKTQKWYLILPCLTLIRYRSRVNWSNPGKGIVPSPTPWCSSYRKGSHGVTLDYGRQLYLTISLKFVVFCFRFQFYFFGWSCFFPLCTHSSRIRTMFKRIYLTHRWDPNRYNHSGSKWM